MIRLVSRLRCLCFAEKNYSLPFDMACSVDFLLGALCLDYWNGLPFVGKHVFVL
jgi:hypothetical protein